MDRALVTSYPGCSLLNVFQRLSRYGKCINIPETGVRLISTRKVDVIYVVRVSEVYKPRVSRKSHVKHRLVVTGKNVSQEGGVDESGREVRLIFLGQEVVSELLSIPLKSGVLLGVLNPRHFSACHSSREEVSLTVGPVAAVLWVFPDPKLDGEVAAEAVVDLTSSEDVGNPASPLDNTESDPHYVPGSQSSSSSSHLEESAAPARGDLAKAKSVQGNSIFSGVEDDWPESSMHHSTPAYQKTKKGEKSANGRPAQTSSSTHRQAAVKNVKKCTELFPSSAAVMNRHSADRQRNNKRAESSSPRRAHHRAEKSQEISGDSHVERVTKPCIFTDRPHVENPVCRSLIPPPYGHQHHVPYGHQHHVPCSHQHHLAYPHYGHYNCSSHCCRPAQHPPAHFHPPPADCCNHSGGQGPAVKCGCTCSPTKTHTHSWCSSNVQHPMPVACSCCSHVTSYTPQMSCCNYQKSNCLPNDTHTAILSKCCCNCSPELRMGPCEHNALAGDNPSPNNDEALTRTQDWVMHWEPIQASKNHAGSIDTGSSSSDDAKSCSTYSMRRPEILMSQARKPKSYDLPGPSGVQFNKKPAAPESATSSRPTQVNDVQSSQAFLTQATAGSCPVDVTPPKKKRKLFNPAETIILAEESSESVIGESQPFDTQPSAHPLSSSAPRNDEAQPEVAFEEIISPSPTTSGVNHLKRSSDKNKTNPQTKDDCLRSSLESNRRERVNEEQDNSSALGLLQKANVTSEPEVFSDYSSLQNLPNAEHTQSHIQSSTVVIQKENASDIITSEPMEVLSHENLHQNQQTKTTSLSENTSTKDISKKDCPLKEIPSRSAFREQNNTSDECSNELSDKSNETIDLEAVDEEIPRNTENKKKTKKNIDEVESGGTKEISKKDSPLKAIPSRSASREQKKISDECSDESSDKSNETIDLEAVEEIPRNTENKNKTKKIIDEVESGGTKEISKKGSPLKAIPSRSAFREQKKIFDECSDESSDKSNETIDLEVVGEEIPRNTENKKKTIDDMESDGIKEISEKDSPLKANPSGSAFREQKKISDECSDEMSATPNETINLEVVIKEIPGNTENRKKTRYKMKSGGIKKSSQQDSRLMEIPSKSPSRDQKKTSKDVCDQLSDKCNETIDLEAAVEEISRKEIKGRKTIDEIEKGGIKDIERKESPLDGVVNPSGSPRYITNQIKSISADSSDDHTSPKSNESMDFEAVLKIQKKKRRETILFSDDEMELTQPTSTPQSFVDARSQLSATSQESRRGTPEKWIMKHVDDIGGGAAEDVIRKLNELNVVTPLGQPLDLPANRPFRVTGIILAILPSLKDPFSIVFGRCNANCAGIFPYEELKEMEVGDQADCPHCRLRAHRLCPACHALGFRHMLCLFFQLEIHLLVDTHVLRIELEHKRAADFLGCSPGTYLRCYPRLLKKLKAITFNSPPPHKNVVVQLNATVRRIVKEGLTVLTFQDTELRKHLSIEGAPYKFINIK